LSYGRLDSDKKENITVLSEKDKCSDGVLKANGEHMSYPLKMFPPPTNTIIYHRKSLPRRWLSCGTLSVALPGWANIDFVFENDTNTTKILEGKYEGGSQRKDMSLTSQIQGVYNGLQKIKQKEERKGFEV
jgi:hypothetical protein